MPLTELEGATPKQTFYTILHSAPKRPDGVVVQTDRRESRSSEAPDGGVRVPRFTEDVIEAETIGEAERIAIEQWKASGRRARSGRS